MSSAIDKKRQQKKRTRRKHAACTGRDAEQQLLMQDPECFLLQKGLY